jgi:hypothetical protein
MANNPFKLVQGRFMDFDRSIPSIIFFGRILVEILKTVDMVNILYVLHMYLKMTKARSRIFQGRSNLIFKK